MSRNGLAQENKVKASASKTGRSSDTYKYKNLWDQVHGTQPNIAPPGTQGCSGSQEHHQKSRMIASTRDVGHCFPHRDQTVPFYHPTVSVWLVPVTTVTYRIMPLTQKEKKWCHVWEACHLDRCRPFLVGSLKLLRRRVTNAALSLQR